MKRPSPALVVALIALFVSLGGTGYAALKVTGKNVKNSSLTGKDVKNSSLMGKDVRNRSLAAKDFKPGQLPAGPKGATGGQGRQGLPGAAAATAFASVAANGTLRFGKGVASATKVGSYYLVTFNRSTTGCVAVATPTGSGAELVADASANEVQVYTYNSAGAVADNAFSLALLC